MTGKKYTENISQLALANVDYDMQNRHHMSYNFMMIHANVQSVGDYTGKTPSSVTIMIIRDLPVASKRMTTY